MEGFGAHYAVTLHRAELRQELVKAHPQPRKGLPRLRWPWRLAIGAASAGAVCLAMTAIYPDSAHTS